MLLYNLSISIVSLTWFTILLLIVQTVELASFAASTHCLEGFALLCIHVITRKSFFLNHFLYQKNTQRKTHKERVRISWHFYITKILIVFQWPEWSNQCDGCCFITIMSLEMPGWRWSSVYFIWYFCEIETAPLKTQFHHLIKTVLFRLAWVGSASE